MALVNDIETYGRAADAGEMSNGEAVLALMAKHPGSLAKEGAADCIANWQSVRSAHEQVYEDAARSLSEMNAPRGITEK